MCLMLNSVQYFITYSMQHSESCTTDCVALVVKRHYTSHAAVFSECRVTVLYFSHDLPQNNHI